MPSKKKLKLALLGIFAILTTAWIASGTFYTVFGTSTDELSPGPDYPTATSDDYVGTEVCAACHEEQFKSFSRTKHSKLGDMKSWKGKVQGCESCHGPGKAHVDASGDKTKIISFKVLDQKTASESCLVCHSGKESHNNFRRGEHWRNDVGCNDCHTAHPKGGETLVENPGSITLVKEQPSDRMLRQGEPQLCINCHNETKSQFGKPFHHKVLEGTMKCTDCHNAHGGFEAKQTKLSVGADIACIRCHSNKQGPFIFEHAPLKVEGCTVCHIPHGSANPKMLKRPVVRQLCMECHTGITEEQSPQLPSRHNQAAMRETQCTVCHSAIHGSNSSRLFFR